MKLWEILNEENLKRYVRMTNMADFDFEESREFYVISKNKNGKIGLFASDGFQDCFLPSDMVLMEFELIEKTEIKPKYNNGQKAKPERSIRRMRYKTMGGIFISDKHCEIASAKETFTIVDVAPGWLYEPMYKVEENDLIWSESMLVQIEEYSIKEEMLCGKE